MKQLLIFLTVGLMLNSCSSNQKPETQVKHIVMCWLKKDTDQNKFIESVKNLKSIQQVQNISVGTKINSVEPVADNTFDIAFTITFKSNDDLKVYLDHPSHIKAVTEVLKPALAKVVVYDYQEL